MSLLHSTSQAGAGKRNAGPLLVAAGDRKLSGLVAEPVGRPRGMLVALHGGGSRAAYFDSPADPAGSLLEVASALGWRGIALDRPGYGASSGPDGGGFDVRTQASLLAVALAGLRGPDRLPVALVGHSLGALTALQLARILAEGPAGTDLVAIALAGLPLAYTAEQAAGMSVLDATGPTLRRPPGPPRDPRDWLGPESTWPPGLREHLTEVLCRVPSAEIDDARTAPATAPALLRQAAVRVQVAVPEFEATMSPAAEILSIAETALHGVGGSETVLVRGAWHNLSLGHRARAYHLGVLAFAEEAIADRASAGLN